ncbi:MAG TPA: nickel pincer cofactor biosynthesis protein LarC [Actinomycetota bacterium]|nr:nickel pincer cofactor biosynthesis protein LarC [Actinomycetota bacterium]
MRVMYVDCIGGVSGDMLLGALVDAGADRSAILDAVGALGVRGWSLDFELVERGGIRAIHAKVAVERGSSTRDYADIRLLLERAPLSEGTRRRAERTFEALARAEAAIHGQDVDDVHFHEVGALDALVDIVGVCAAIESISPDRVTASPVPAGSGTTVAAHGALPVPAPATVELLKGAIVTGGGEGETVTPTGAALLRANCTSFGAMPPMRLWASGYGAGTRDTATPNVVRVLVGDAETEAATETVDLIETNLDDMNPELVPYAMERLLDAGALDVWASPVNMKKGRLGVVLGVLADRSASPRVIDVLFRETTTLGLRISAVHREVADRKEVHVTVADHPVRVKVASRGGRTINAAPEFDDAVAVARATGIPLKDVYAAALRNLPDD